MQLKKHIRCHVLTAYVFPTLYEADPIFFHMNKMFTSISSSIWGISKLMSSKPDYPWHESVKNLKDKLRDLDFFVFPQDDMVCYNSS